MKKEKLTAREIADPIEERIGRRAAILVMRDHPINGWYTQVVAPGDPKLVELKSRQDQRRLTRAVRARRLKTRWPKKANRKRPVHTNR
jgi:hypothetical protein